MPDLTLPRGVMRAIELKTRQGPGGSYCAVNGTFRAARPKSAFLASLMANLGTGEDCCHCESRIISAQQAEIMENTQVFWP